MPPAASLHASHNLFIYPIFERLTADTEITPYITGEFGVGLALTSLVVAYVFWRRQPTSNWANWQGMCLCDL